MTVVKGIGLKHHLYSYSLVLELFLCYSISYPIVPHAPAFLHILLTSNCFANDVTLDSVTLYLFVLMLFVFMPVLYHWSSECIWLNDVFSSPLDLRWKTTNWPVWIGWSLFTKKGSTEFLLIKWDWARPFKHWRSLATWLKMATLDLTSSLYLRLLVVKFSYLDEASQCSIV